MKEINKKEIVNDMEWMKAMMESARKEPSKNLSYRIMHQIETEQALSRAKPTAKKQSTTTSPLNDLLFCFISFPPYTILDMS